MFASGENKSQEFAAFDDFNNASSNKADDSVFSNFENNKSK